MDAPTLICIRADRIPDGNGGFIPVGTEFQPLDHLVARDLIAWRLARLAD